MVISGLGSGGARRSKATARPARTFTLGPMAAHQHSGKCVESTVANSLDMTKKGGRLDPWCQVSEGEEKADPGNSPEETAAPD